MDEVSPALQKIIGGVPRRPGATPPAPDESEYAAFAHGRIGNRPQQMLVFKKAGGETFGFPYMNLLGISSSNVELGFTLDFGPIKVNLVGKNLARLWRYVTEFRAAEIVEADRSDQFLDDAAAALVTQIVRVGL